MTENYLDELNTDLGWALTSRRRFLKHVESLMDAISEIYVEEIEDDNRVLLDRARDSLWDLVEHKLKEVSSELADAKSSLCKKCGSTQEEEYASIKERFDSSLRALKIIPDEE
jgi:hypothetical protein